MRVYLPLTVTMLRAAVAAGEVRSVIAYAVTPGLREWYAEGDQDELEYTALTAAARESLRLLATDPAAPRRRVVLAVDVDGVQPRDGEERRPLTRSEPVPRRKVGAGPQEGGPTTVP